MAKTTCRLVPVPGLSPDTICACDYRGFFDFSAYAKPGVKVRSKNPLSSGFIEWKGQSRTTATFTKTNSAALAAIPGLSATLEAGKTYSFQIDLYTTVGNINGLKVNLNGGTATATSSIGFGPAFPEGDTTVAAQTKFSALNTLLCDVSGMTGYYCRINGTVTVNATGTFVPRFAQHNASVSSSTVVIGSTMILNQIN